MPPKKQFKNMTMRTKFQMYFVAAGYRTVPSRSSKYIVMSNGNQFIFLGASGAVRVNHRNSAGGSQSYTPQFKRVMEQWAINQGYSL